MQTPTFVSAIGQDAIQPDASTKRYMIVETSGDWIALYDRLSGEALMQGHPSDYEPLEFLARMDALGVDVAQIDRRRHWAETLTDNRSRLPQNLAHVELR